MKCDSSSHYFGRVPKNKKLKNVVNVTIEVITIARDIMNNRNFSELNIDPSHTILDIDLDYFSCNNPQLTGVLSVFNLTKQELEIILKPTKTSTYCFDGLPLYNPSVIIDPSLKDESKNYRLYNSSENYKKSLKQLDKEEANKLHIVTELLLTPLSKISKKYTEKEFLRDVQPLFDLACPESKHTLQTELLYLFRFVKLAHLHKLHDETRKLQKFFKSLIDYSFKILRSNHTCLGFTFTSQQSQYNQSIQERIVILFVLHRIE